MTRDRFDAVVSAAKAYADAAYDGIRIKDKESEKLIADWTQRNCRERNKSSKYFVHRYSDNLGTKKYPYIIERVAYDKISDYKETPETFRLEFKDGTYTYVKKTSIIGWLS